MAASQPLTITLKLSPELNVQKINVLLKALKTSLGTLGRDIQLMDEKKINAALSTIDSHVRQTKTGLQDAAKQGTALEQSLNKVSQAGRLVSKTGSLVSNAFSFNQLAMGMQMFTSALNQFTQPFVELDKQVKNIGTLGRENFQEFTAMASELASKLPNDAADIAKGVYQAVSASMQGTNQDLLDFVEVAAKAGVAGLSNTESAVNGFTSVINAYGMKTTEVNKVSDMFFASVKLGKTTFEEINSSLANYLPTAAALGVSFDQTSTAIVELTKQGTPTSQAATQINSALISIIKGNKFMNSALKSSGTSLEELQKKLKLPVEQGGGLVNVLREVKLASEKSGTALIKMTGRAEGMKIIESLVGSQEKYNNSLKTFNDIQNEIASGVSTKAFETANESIAAQTAGFMSTVQHYFDTAFQAIGQGATGTLDIMTKLMPAILGFSALGPMFLSLGKGSAGLATTLIQKLMPAMMVTAAAQKGVEVGTLGSASAFKVLGKAMMTTPLGLVITGLTALVAAYLAFHKSSEDIIEDKIKEAEADKNLLAAQKKKIQADKDSYNSNVGLIKQYEDISDGKYDLVDAGTKEEEITKKLKRIYPDIINDTKSYKDNLEALKDAAGLQNVELDKMTENNQNLIKEYEILNIKENLSAAEKKRLATVTNQLSKEFPGVIEGATDFGAALNTMKQKAGMSVKALLDLDNQLAQVERKMASADAFTKGVQIDKAINKSKELVGSNEKIAKSYDTIVKQLKAAKTEDEITKIYDRFYDTIVVREERERYKADQSRKKELAYLKSKGELTKKQQDEFTKLANKKFTDYSIGVFFDKDAASALNTQFEKIMNDVRDKLKAEEKINMFADLSPDSKRKIDEFGNYYKKQIEDSNKEVKIDELVKQYEELFKTEKIFKEVSQTGKQFLVDDIINYGENRKKQLAALDLEGEDNLNGEGFDDAKKAAESLEQQLNKLKDAYVKTNDAAEKNKLLEQIKALQLEINSLNTKKILLEFELNKGGLDTAIKDAEEKLNKKDKLKITTKAEILPEINQDEMDIELDVARLQLSDFFNMLIPAAEQLSETFNQAFSDITSGARHSEQSVVALAFSQLKALIPIFIAEIFGSSIGTLGPIAGPIVSGVLTGTLYGLLAKAENSYKKAIAPGAQWGGYISEGYNRRRGPRDTKQIWIEPGEFVVKKSVVQKTLPILQQLNEGKEPNQLFNQSFIVGYDIADNRPDTKIANAISQLTTIFNQVKAVKPNITVENIIRLESDYSSKSQAAKDFHAGIIPFSDYTKSLKSFATGSPLLSSPTPAIIGDNTSFREAAMLEPQIAEVGRTGAAEMAGEIRKSHRDLIATIENQTKVIQDLETRFYVIEKDVAEGTNRHNNKQSRRVRT